MTEIRTALVTGGAGFIGRHLVAQLVEMGTHVRVLDPGARQEDFPMIEFGGKVELLPKSVHDEGTLKASLKDVTHVFHLAANAHLWADQRRDFDDINHLGTAALFKTTAGLPIEKIVITSSEVILRGWRNGSPVLISERDSAKNIGSMAGPYSRSKYLQDSLAREAAATGQPVVVVCPTVPVGPGDTRLTAPSRMILDFVNGKSPAYMETGLNLVPVEEAARGHILAALKGAVGERYILGGDNFYLSDLLTSLERMTGKDMPTTRIPWWMAYISAHFMEATASFITHRPPSASIEGVRLALHDGFVDTSKARIELGFVAGSVDDALLRALRWFKQADLSSDANSI